MLAATRTWKLPHQTVLLERVAWLTPIAVLVLARRLPELRMHQLIAVTIGVLLVTALSRRPGLVACALVVGFPIAEVVLPIALRWGAPGPLVRAAGSWKEAMTLTLVVAAMRHRRAHPVKPDRLDLLAAGFVLVVVVYYLFPTWLASTDLIIPADARTVAARTFAIPIVAMIAGRHAGIADPWRRRVAIAAAFAGVLIGIGAIVEIVWPSTWQRFLHDVLDVNGYQRTIFSNEAERTFIFSDPTQSGETSRRAASIFGSHLDSAFALLLPLGVAFHLLRRRWSTATVVSAGLIGVGLALTQTRSAILGGALIAVGALRSRSGGSSNRIRLALGLGLAAVVLLPLVADSALATRITGAITGEDQESAPEHTERSRDALDAVIANPLGQGLASSGNVANRFAIRGSLLPENHYLQLALDVGMIGSLLFIGVVVTGARLAHRRARRTDHLLDAAVASALAATALAGLFLGTFAVITSALPMLVAVGLATAPIDEPDDPPDDASTAARATAAAR